MGRRGPKGIHRYGRTKKVWEPTPQQLDIYERSIQGDKTQREIASEEGVSQQTVQRLIARIDRWLAPQYMDNIRQIKANHTSRLMKIHNEAMTQWKKSKQVFKITVQTMPDANGKVKKTRTVEARAGDANLLKVGMEALEQVRVMWGMNAPEKIEGETTLRIGGLNRSEAIEERKKELEEAQASARQAMKELDAEQDNSAQG